MKKSVWMILLVIAGTLAMYGVLSWRMNQKIEAAVNQQVSSQWVSGRQSMSAMPVSMPNAIPAGNMDFTYAAEHTVNAVVHISTAFTQKSRSYDDFFGEFLDHLYGIQRSPKQNERQVLGFGSGVILSEDGYIVTNNHVVEGAEFIDVILNDKRTYEAAIIGRDPTTDLALIKIEAQDLPFIEYGNSDAVRVGEWVLAVGNPFNLTSTVTAGIVSAKARNIQILSDQGSGTIESFIQTDAAVNRGNSGGALVDVNGKLIGINAAIASGSGYYTGYSFAIPINIVKKVVSDLMMYGELQRAYIGISMREVDAALAKEKNLSSVEGIYVAEVIEEGAAAAAGIKAGDVILKVDEETVNSSARLLEIIGQKTPGDVINLTVNRNGSKNVYAITLLNINNSTEVVKKDNIVFVNEFGIGLTKISDKTCRDLHIAGGARIEKISQGIVAQVGIQRGFIITAIDKQKVLSPSDAERLLNQSKGGVLIEGVYPNGKKMYYGIGLNY
ncbi:MAG: trypsin-like peptidase domain-containing protein [Bacteroidales bacterium]|nr:trypsin-like peptidase domain-containing protein [Bacteroidales bacterium]